MVECVQEPAVSKLLVTLDKIHRRLRASQRPLGQQKPIILNIQIATLLRSREASVVNVLFFCELNLYPRAQTTSLRRLYCHPCALR